MADLAAHLVDEIPPEVREHAAVRDVDRLLRFGRVPEDEARLRRWAREWEVEERLDRAIATAKRGSDG